MSDGSAPPGGYFIGRPANTDEHSEPPPPAAEPAPAVNLPNDYFVGRPGNHQAEKPAPKPEPGFLAKCFPCLAPGDKAIS
ncbi:uncharacterized protein [Lolium perenne]|uniref:uncharacterized protein n=1 Tax=Lolium perenne TaxID=4522 RepID=UPI0021EA0994